MRWFIICLLFSSCTQGSDRILKVGVNSDILTLDPHATADPGSSRIVAQVYNRLIEKDIDGHFQPSLATSWKYINPTTLEIKIRDGVQFHNGAILDADDVVFSIDRIKSTPGLLYDLAREILSVRSFQSNIVHITTTPSPSFVLHALAHNHAAILHKETTKSSDISITAIGTGGFTIKKQILGDSILLERFDHYFDGIPPTKYILIRTIPEELARQAGLETGELDIAYTGRITERDFETNKNLQNFEPVKFESARLEYLAMNFKNAIFTNLTLRQAIFSAIDRTNIVKITLEGYGIPTTAIVPPRVYKTKGIPDTIPRITFSNLDPLIFGVRSEHQKEAEIIQANLKEIGINTKIRIYEQGAFLEELNRGSFDIFIHRKIVATQHPDEYFRHLFHSQSPPSVGNASFYQNPVVDTLLDEALQDHKVYQQIIDILQAEYALIPIYVPIYTYTKHKNITGFYLDPIFSLRLEKTEFIE
ncbi:MAG: ABC transporter substrate-binding protein [Brevinema sp.]